MDSESAPEVEAPVPSSGELRGSVLDVVSALLADNDRDAVLEVVRKLVAENEDMVRRLARIASRFKKSEKVGKAQLVLFLDALQRGEGEPETESEDDLGPDEVDEADAKLSAASGADDLKRDDELAALKAQLEALQAKVDGFERAPAREPQASAGASFITVERGSRMEFVAPTAARDRGNVNDDAGFTIAITPSADLPAPVAEIALYGYVKGDVIYDRVS